MTRYSDVAQALQSPSLSSQRADTKFAALPRELQEASVDFKASLSRWMLFTDPPEHTRIRALTNKVFSSLAVERVRPRIEQVVDRLLSAALPSGRMDVICVGGALGLLETQIAIEALFRRMPRLRLTGEQLDWKVSLLFRGARSLPVVF